MITEKTKELIATFLAGLVNTADKFDIGLGGNATSSASTTLDVPLTTVPTTTGVVTADNVIEFQAIFDGADSTMTGNVIREFGITDGTNLLARVNFDGVGPFASNEDLEIFYTIEVE
jgi:hypothetical protein